MLSVSPCLGTKAIFSLRQLPQKVWESVCCRALTAGIRLPQFLPTGSEEAGGGYLQPVHLLTCMQGCNSECVLTPATAGNSLNKKLLTGNETQQYCKVKLRSAGTASKKYFTYDDGWSSQQWIGQDQWSGSLILITPVNNWPVILGTDLACFLASSSVKQRYKRHIISMR